MKTIYNLFSPKGLCLFTFLFYVGISNAQYSNAVTAQVTHPEEGLVKLDGKPNSVELIEKRSLSSRTFNNKDGSKTQVSYNYPVHYEKNGLLLSIDNTIKPNNSSLYPQYGFVNSDNVFTTYVPNTIDNGFLMKLSSGDILKDMQSPKMYFASNNQNIGVVGISNSSVNVSGEIATYTEVYPHVDLRLIFHNGVRKADYIIKSADFLANIPNNVEYLVFEESVTLPNGWVAELSQDRILFKQNNQYVDVFYNKPLIYQKPVLNSNSILPIDNSKNKYCL